MGGNGNEMEGLLAWFFFLFFSVLSASRCQSSHLVGAGV